MSILDLPQREFMAMLPELAQQGVDTDALLRQYRSANSPLAGVNQAAEAAQAGIADEGRRGVAGGLLSKDVGTTGMDALRSLRVEPMAGLLGMLSGAGQAVEAPSAAARGLIPVDDVALEALGTAGMAMAGGGAAVAPRGALRAGIAREAKDASGIFGEGTQRVTYRDPDSGGFIEVLQRPNGTASVLGLEVPEAFRGRGIGQSLQSAAMTENPRLMGQVSSKAAATTAYRLGRRPYGQPDASLEDVFRMIDEDSSVNMLTPDAQPSTLAANANTSGGLLATAASDALTPSQQMARRILDMRAAGRARDVTDDMMAQADPQYMFANTPLPMDAASRMARAEAVGFDTQNLLYHGTDASEIKSFNPSIGAERLPATFLTDSRRVASTYGDNVGEYFANVDYPAEFDFYGRSATNFDGESLSPSGLVRRVKGAADDARLYGAETDTDLAFDLQSADIDPMYADEIDAVRMRSVVDDFGFGGDPANNLAVFNPSSIRNRAARFDPEFSHLSNLSAANASPATGLLGVSAVQEDKKELPFMNFMRGLLQ